METNYCMITDSKDKPMFWSENDGQLCYCNIDRTPTIYTNSEAEKYVEKTLVFRGKREMYIDRYIIRPVDFSEEVVKLITSLVNSVVVN